MTEEDCKKWPREVCTIQKELKAKFNPVTKCEKVMEDVTVGDDIYSAIFRYPRSCVDHQGVGLSLVQSSAMTRQRLLSRIFLMRFVIFSHRGNVST